MAEQLAVMEGLAQQVRGALSSADLSSCRDLLDPNVHWGGPDDPTASCQNRDQVLAWYRRGRDAGVRATVSEVAVAGDQIVVGLTVVGNQAGDDDTGVRERWQVLTVRDGRVIDIVGFDDRVEAATRAGLPAA
jgi:ketosteroid isomerase-like protein